jgi:hypothetical protein
MITKELIEQDIKVMEAQLAGISGSLTYARQLVAYLDRQAEAADGKKAGPISPANEVIQAAEEEKQALSESQLAELVGGPGAVVEAIEPIDATVTEISSENEAIVQQMAANKAEVEQKSREQELERRAAAQKARGKYTRNT